MLEQRIADITDIHFINSCILYGARKGHYLIDVDNQVVVECMKKEIKSVINNQKLLDNRHAQATVYSADNKRVAMVIISEATPGSSCYEIYAISVIKGHQGKGYGSQILDSILNRFLYLDVYARCLPASVRMEQLLVQRGFKFDSMDKGFKVMLKAAADYCNIAEPLYMNYGVNAGVS